MSDPSNEIRRHVLRDGEVSAAILSLGCITQDWRVPLGNGSVPVVLGYDDPTAYLQNPYFMGAVVGRVANRVSGASFVLDDQPYCLDVNEAPHHLHGGSGGIHTKNWTMEPDGPRSVEMRLLSPDGEQGYPGRVEFTVRISLRGNRLRYDMIAISDRPTPINMAQHNYYNLMGGGTVFDHDLCLAAGAVTPTGSDLIPTGEIVALNGQRYDFQRFAKVRAADPGMAGLDLNYVLERMRRAATLRAPNGMMLTLDTDQPCLQVFTAPGLQPLAGSAHRAFGGICLEPQGFPDAVNQPGFPSIVITPDRPYHQRLDVTVSAVEDV